MSSELPKAYEPSLIEEKWAKFWVEQGLFHVPTPREGEDVGPRFVQLLPPPNVTGRLHMGHMLNQTEMDILTRWHRMRGETALWLPGTDHAGIATQMMVERQLTAEGGPSRTEMGREAFTERVWCWKKQYGGAITEQMRRLGASVDWSREYFTMDDRLSRAVKEAFIRLWEQGLIYRGAYIVNWDPVLATAVSDLEVVHEERMGKLYHIRYPLADGSGSITIATTRPETMLGDVAVAVNPNDERYQEFIGKTLILPLSAAAGKPDREIPVVADEWANPEFGTGAVKVTPAHDPNDFAIGLRHNLPQLSIMDEHAKIKLPGSPYDGLDRFAARERIVEDLRASGALVDIKEHQHAIALSQRTGEVIEPRLSMQWFIKIQPLADKAIEAVDKGYIRFTPENYKKTYDEWMRNIHDWCISRQLWWGHRIPGVALREVRWNHRRARDAASMRILRLGRNYAGDRRTGHVVQLRPAAVYFAGMGRRQLEADRGSRGVLSDRSARDGFRHSVLLGGAHDHARLPLHAGCADARWLATFARRVGAIPRGLHSRPGARCRSAEDVED